MSGSVISSCGGGLNRIRLYSGNMSASTFAVSSPDGTDAVAALAGASPGPASVPALQMMGLVKAFDRKVAVDRLSLDIPVSSFYGIVGPNGAGKTTSLSMATGLLRPDAGQVLVHGVDVWTQPQRAKTLLGVLPDGLRTFDRLNGLELVTYSGLLRGLDRDVVVPRATELVKVLGLWDAGTTLVADYSAGMRKKIHLACAMVHSPSILVLDEPFEAVDPISAQTIQAILRDYAAAGGTVVISSHVMATVQRLCDHVAIINAGRVVAAGTTEQVAAGADLEQRFTELVGGPGANGGAVMVATLVKLKWRLTLNALTKNVWAIVGTAIGALYGIGALVMVLTGAVGLGLKVAPDVIMLVLGALGALLVAGWAVVPLLVTGVDSTLDPRAMAAWTAPSRGLALGLLAAGALGIPGCLTAAVCLIPVLTWLLAASSQRRSWRCCALRPPWPPASCSSRSS